MLCLVLDQNVTFNLKLLLQLVPVLSPFYEISANFEVCNVLFICLLDFAHLIITF